MKLSIPQFTVPPSADFTPFPAAVSIVPGKYFMVLRGQIKPHSINTGQCTFQLNIGENDGPAIGAIEWTGMVMQNPIEGPSFAGNLAVNTGMSAMTNIGPCVAPEWQDFLWLAKVDVTAGNPLALLANVAEVSEGPAETVEFRDVTIEVIPIA